LGFVRKALSKNIQSKGVRASEEQGKRGGRAMGGERVERGGHSEVREIITLGMGGQKEREEVFVI